MYSCVIILWALVILGTSALAGLVAACMLGFISGFFHLAGTDWPVLISAIVLFITVTVWFKYDRHSNFMVRSALAVIRYLKKSGDDN